MRTHFRKRRFRGSSPLERLMILVVIAALLGVVIGLALPKISPSIGGITLANTLPPARRRTR